MIGQRVGRLSERCRSLLVSASVMGREFGLDALARLSGLPRDELLDVLDEAMAERVARRRAGIARSASLRPRADQGHALRRADAGAADAGSTSEAAEALEAVYAADLEPHLAELAQHFFAAAPAGVADKAIEYARRAGDRAASQLAHEEAVRLYRMAIDALSVSGEVDELARCELLLALGEAQARAGDATAAKEALSPRPTPLGGCACRSSSARPPWALKAGSYGPARPMKGPSRYSRRRSNSSRATAP